VDKALRDCAAASPYCRDLVGHQSQVRRVAASPDGKFIASCGDDAMIRIWQTDALQAQPNLLTGHERNVACVAFSSNGRQLVSASHDGTARLWDVATGKTLREFTGHVGPLWAVDISPDGNWLAAAGYDQVSEESAAKRPQHDILLWDLRRNAAPIVLQGHTDTIQCVAFSPDSQMLVSGSNDETVRQWELSGLSSAPKPTTLAKALRGVMWVAFRPDGKELAVASDMPKVTLLDLAHPGAPSRELAGKELGMGGVDYSPDGRFLAAGSGDRQLRIWDLADASAEPRVLGPMAETVWSVAYCNPNQIAITCPEPNVYVWDLAVAPSSPQQLTGHSDLIRSLAVNHAGTFLASAGKDLQIRLWPLPQAPGSEPRALRGPTDLIASVAFSPDDSLLAAASWEGKVWLWRPTDSSEPIKEFSGHTDIVRSVAFSPDGHTLASSSDDGTIRIWKLTRPDLAPVVLSRPGESLMCVTFSPDGKTIAAGCSDARVWLWDAQQAATAAPRMLRGAQDSVLCIAFSSNGRWLAAGGFDRTIRLWDLAQPETEPLALRSHSREVFTVAFSPDNTMLASCSRDHLVLLWNLAEPGSEPEVLDGKERAVMALAFTPDGHQLASAGVDGTIRLWPVSALDLYDQIARLPNRNLTADEWQKKVSADRPYEITLPELPPGHGAPGGVPESKRPHPAH
jgi:WD40 repeat protein